MPFWKKMFNKRQGVYYPRAVVQGKLVETPVPADMPSAGHAYKDFQPLMIFNPLNFPPLSPSWRRTGRLFSSLSEHIYE